MPNKEFDFEQANAKFQKPTTTTDNASTSAQTNGGLLDSIPPPSSESPGNFYDKKSGFFDNISSEVKERYERSTPAAHAENGEGSAGGGFFDTPGGRGGRGGRGGGGRGRGRANRIAEEQKNMQTFGDTGSQFNSSGGRGGRGRGGRGGGYRGGRGRGGPRQGNGEEGYSNAAPMRMG